MAYREVFINSADAAASDLYNSGCPRAVVSNSQISPATILKADITAASGVVTIHCNNNASAVALAAAFDTATLTATAGELLLFVNDTTSNAAAQKRNFAWFAAGEYAVVGSDVVITLTGGQVFHTTAAGLDWGVGGVRATARSASSSRLFYNFGRGDLARTTPSAGQSTRTVICAAHTETYDNTAEWRIALPGYFLSGTGGTQHHIVSEAYSSTPVAGRPRFTFSGNMTVNILYEGADLDWDAGMLAGIDFVRASGTNVGTGTAAFRFFSHVRLVDCGFYCATGASFTGRCITINNGTAGRGSAVVGCYINGYTTFGIHAQNVAGVGHRIMDNTIIGGTDGFYCGQASTWEALITGNKIANCSANGIWWQAAGGAGGRGASAPVIISHNSIVSCGNGIKIDPGSATIPEYQLTMVHVYNNNVERCTVGITTAGTIVPADPAAAILEGLGVLIYGNNTGAGASACTTRYGTQAAIIREGEKQVDTGMAWTGSAFVTRSPLAATAGVGGSSLGASMASAGGGGDRSCR